MENWKYENGNLILKTKDFKMKNKCAIFDVDDTIITTKSKKKFAVDNKDWEFKYDTTDKIIKKYIKKKYAIIFITNQNGLKTDSQKDDWKEKMNSVIEKLEIDVLILSSTLKNGYRKPMPLFFRNYISHSKFDFEKSFYCGDAIGREHDFSDCDLKFALNSNINFKSPEEIFLNTIIEIPEINYPDLKKIQNYNFDIKFMKKNIIIMVGFSGSGKSCVSEQLKQIGYEILNQDALKTLKNCEKKCSELIKLEKSIVIDATNPSDSIRNFWIKIADRYNYTTRVVLMTTLFDIAKHNNYYRAFKNDVEAIPDIAYRVFNKKYVEPCLNEGLTEIIKCHSSKPQDDDYYLFMY